MIRLTHHRQLFLDSHLIEWREKLERRVNPVTKHPANPVIRPEANWEPRGYVARSVLFDEEDGLYKAWCTARLASGASQDADQPIDHAVVHFTSEDGIYWDRAELDLLEVDGQRTNVVALNKNARHPKAWPALNECFGVVKDDTDPDPTRRYKMGYLYLISHYTKEDRDPFHPSEFRALGAAFSPDGVHWTDLNQPVSRATCDGFTHWTRDLENRKWILYGRTKVIPPDLQARYGEDKFWRKSYWGRAVRRAESEDFVHWTPEYGEVCLTADLEDGPWGEIYGMNVFPYEGLYIGMPELFYNSPDDAYLEMQLAVSRDSRTFERLTDRSPFIPVGGVGAWDRFNNSNIEGAPIRVGDELRFYYGGRPARHPGAYAGHDDVRNVDGMLISGMGLGTIKLDRFAGMEATFDPGRLVTKPLLFDGATLHVNARVPFGKVEVALLAEDESPVEGAVGSVTGEDGVDLSVDVPGLAAQANRPVRLQFTVWNGQLYSFWID